MIANGIAKYYPHDPRYVITKDGIIYSSANGGHQSKTPKWKKLRLFLGNGDGKYQAVSFGAGKRKLVHRIVYETFVSECPPNMDIRHLDGNSFNNALSNLSVGTRLENMADARMHKTTPRGERNARSKLTSKDVLKIRSMASEGLSQTNIAKIIGISIEAVSQIIRRKRWGWLE